MKRVCTCEGMEKMMKEFAHTLKQTFLVNKRDILLYAIVTSAGSVVGMLITLLILYIDGTGEDYVQMGAFLAILIGGIMLSVGGLLSIPIEFNLAVSMGRTRKYFATSRYISWMVNVAVVMMIVLLTSVVEDAIYLAIYPGAVCRMDVRAAVGSPVVFLGIVLCIPAIILMLGALVLRFANKFLWIFWGVAMLFNLFGRRIADTVQENPESLLGRIGYGIADIFVNGSVADSFLVVLGVGASGLVIAILILRKQRVTI